MVRLCGQDPFEDLTSLQRSRVILVGRQNGNRLIDGERIEERAFIVVRIAPMDLFHRGFVSQHSRRVITLLPVQIVMFNRGNVFTLSRGWCAGHFCFFNGLPPAIEGRSVW